MISDLPMKCLSSLSSDPSDFGVVDVEVDGAGVDGGGVECS